jgi:peptidoglycan/xylan/chitin deacetylase (PgdA/CDA1 family)
MKPVRILRSYLRKGVLVLLYHRVSELRRDPWSLCVTPARFAQQLQVLREKAHPIRLSELTANLRRRMFRPAVAVTFDDGYADNLHQAAPLLRHFGIPATVFAVSGAIREGREFWWDELEKIVFEPEGTRGLRQVTALGRRFTWSPPENGAAERDSWRAWKDQAPTPAHEVYRELYGILSALPPADRRTLIEDLVHQAGVSPAARATHRPLSCAELRELAQSPTIDIGVHTVSHPVLSRLPVAQQAQEVLQAKSDLETITGKPMRQFSYPHGKREHWDRNTIELVRSAGFEYAYTNEAGVADVSLDRFQMPRVVVPADEGAFARWLRRCLGTLG